ncbi:MAG: polysaccharide deacetylase family protein [Schwartzia succinivorans]|jgi:peptidoglycan/xylan/chitin deacetylase (PgdA/CDA1 family)|uniref:polysaccharide deacetylase family protein n=1 Tax=Schwartzia succinivorans TaxID=55507 RepID=UPI002353DBAD|nr:polysaccharide deacetylase family protein [Schwartzia succinivorans]MBE6097275.1 polysaccharide deacetylase family protein [Schwartzia succinivorans]MBQ3863859.1 polysaccharide deacetylase family protein [Schwartzia sp. (in: firmicutes)]MDY6295102.1 polysaccharide deacetylase family protein [Schwartzia succinivorans]
MYISRYDRPKRKSSNWLGRIFGAAAVLVILTAAVFGVTAAFPPEGVLILEYHKVNDWSEDSYTVKPEDFAAQMDELRAQGYETISILDFLRAKKGKQTLPEKAVIVTLDDGYKDNYTDMLPIMESRGMKATVFMVTNDIGLPGYLTWDMLRDMQNRGIEIGSHTANHLPLTEMSPADAREEVQLSKTLMEWNGIKTIFGLSYPNGKYKDFMPQMLKESEYLAAVTGDAGLNTFETNPYLLHRINIPRPHFGIEEFRLRIWKAKIFARLGLFQNKG